MDSNQKRFIEDALDLLNELDEGLMQLEANPAATAPLEQVFRTMHTIKGGANMFGFLNIGELAHHLETLYDLVRQEKLQVTDSLISITLQAFDKVRDLFKEKDLSRITDSPEIANHIRISEDFLKKTVTHAGDQSFVANARKNSITTFFVRVSPLVEITADGNHSLIFIVKDVEALGTSRKSCHMKDDGTILHWEILLSTTSTQAEVESYFLFVEDECKMEALVLSDGDLFELPGFVAFVEQHQTEPMDLTALKKCIEGLTVRSEGVDDETDVNDNRSSRNRALDDTYIKVSKRKIDDLLNWISELIILQAQLTNASSGLNSPALLAVTEQLEMITYRLRDTSLEIGLVPVETLVTKFKRLVRDLSKTLNKKVNFISEGADTELDKDVIEIMSEPMMHIIRNCIDHGIENPAIRRSLGKSEHGTVKLKAFNSSSFVNLIISDDGKGISKEAVLRKAIEKRCCQRRGIAR